jgi:hypothetical protein
MPDRVARFLVSLSQDPFLTEEFSREPDLVLGEADLTEEDRDVLRSGDSAMIRRYVGHGGSLVIELVTQSSVTNPPPPDPSPPPDPKPGPPPGPPPGSPDKKAPKG